MLSPRMTIDLAQFITRDTESPIYKSVNDKKNYRQLRLENGLLVHLIQDVVETEADSFSKIPSTATSSEYYGSLPRKRVRTVSPLSVSDTTTTITPECESSSDADIDSITDEGLYDCGTPNEKSAAMCLCVRVGSLDDPPELQGLCHYTEHVVLMGNEQFPNVNEFDEYVERHCGYSNGTTEYESTFYEAEIPNMYMEGCLERFAACFKKPLFRDDDIKRELNPVHNEFVDNFIDDDVRLEQLLTSFAREDSPMSKFSWGNNVSLREIPLSRCINVRTEMVKFFNKHYKAEAMSLAVQSQHSLDYMESLVRQFFSDLPTLESQENPSSSLDQEAVRMKLQQLPISINTRPRSSLPFSSDAFNRIHYVERIEEGHHLQIYWIYSPLINRYRAKPLSYIGSLLQHEGNGSLISYLRAKFLALEIVAEVGDSSFDENSLQTVFSVSIQLTDKGLDELPGVLALIQYYIQMLHEMGPQKWYFEEERSNVLSQFRFRNEQSACRNVVDVARHAFIYPMEHVLVGSSLIWDYDEGLIRSTLDRLKFDNAIVCVVSKKAFESATGSTEMIERWASIKYKSFILSERFPSLPLPSSESLKNEIHFPDPNLYITNDFSLQRIDTLPMPRLLHEDSTSKLYWLPDVQFDCPKGYTSFQFTSLLMRDCPQAATCLDIYVSMFEKYVKKHTYPASLANLNFTMKITSVGLIISIFGFSQNLMRLVNTIFEEFVAMPISSTLFETMRIDMLQNYANLSFENSDFSESLNKSIVIEGVVDPLTKRRILYHLTPQQVKSVMNEFIKSSYIQGLIYGNLSEKQACECFIKIRTLIPNDTTRIRFNEISRLGVRQIPLGNSQLFYRAFNSADENLMINSYFQVGECDLTEQLMLSLMVQELQEPLFNTLRTKENLAYMLYPYNECFGNICAFGIVIRSLASKFSVNFILDRLDAFLVEFLAHIESLTIDQFEQLKQAKIKTLKTPFLNMRERHDEYWDEISCFEYRFDIKLQKVALLDQISFNQFRSYCRQIFQVTSRHRLTLISIGNGDIVPETVVPVHSFDLTVFDPQTKSLRTYINYEPKFYDQFTEHNPDQIVYQLYYLRPQVVQTEATYVTDMTGFKNLLRYYQSTDRAFARPDSE